MKKWFIAGLIAVSLVFGSMTGVAFSNDPPEESKDLITSLLEELDLSIGLAYTEYGLDDSWGLRFLKGGPDEYPEIIEFRIEFTGYLSPILTGKESHKMAGLIGVLDIADGLEWTSKEIGYPIAWPFPIRPDIGPALYVELDGSFDSFKDRLVPGIYIKAINIPLEDIEKYLSTVYNWISK